MRSKLSKRMDAQGEFIYSYLCAMKEKSRSHVCRMTSFRATAVDLLKMRRTLLSRYARIANEILMHLRSTQRIRTEVSLYDPIGVDKEGNEITLIDVLGTAPDIVGEAVESLCEQERLTREIHR